MRKIYTYFHFYNFSFIPFMSEFILTDIEAQNIGNTIPMTNFLR